MLYKETKMKILNICGTIVVISALGFILLGPLQSIVGLLFSYALFIVSGIVGFVISSINTVSKYDIEGYLRKVRPDYPDDLIKAAAKDIENERSQ
jgi:hypothetical protein